MSGLNNSFNRFTISDFPTEIIELFAPDHSTSTILILRSVNRRFYNVFSQDKFLKRYLLYSQKEYSCDFRSSSVVKGVKDVLDSLTQGIISNIHGCLRLQILHFESWVSGSIQSMDIIDVPPSAVSLIEEIVDNENEHWLFLSVDENIHIWNITAKPYCLKTEHVGPHSSFKTLPGVKVLVFNKLNGLVTVYKFEKLNFSLHDKFICYMDSSEDSIDNLPSSYSFKFIVVGSFLIAYRHKIPSYQGTLLHLWELNSCIKIAAISLSQLDCNCEFQRLVFDYSTNQRDIILNCRGCKIDLYPATYPNIVVCLKYPSFRLSVVLIFNVELLRVTHFVDTFSSDIISCSINCNIISVVAESHVENFKMFPLSQESTLVYGEPFIFHGCESRNNNNILFKNSSMLKKYNNKVDIVSLASESLITKTVEVNPNFTILAFLDPYFLLMYDSKNPTDTEIKGYFVTSGKEIFTWKNVNVRSKTFRHYFWNLTYPSKLVIHFNEEHLKLVQF